MALYEHVFIARQDLSNAQAEGLVEHFSQILKDNGGTVVGTEYWGLRTLAYKINKNRKGHYAFMRTDSPSGAVKEMERLMGLHDDVMRILTIKVDAHEEGPSAVVQAKNSRDERGGRGGFRGDRDRGPRPDRGDRGDRGGDRGPRRDAPPAASAAPAPAPAESSEGAS
jgi:small subunit ribosomal protein S6